MIINRLIDIKLYSLIAFKISKIVMNKTNQEAHL